MISPFSNSSSTSITNRLFNVDYRDENKASFFSQEVTGMSRFGNTTYARWNDTTYPNFSSPLFPSFSGYKNVGYFHNNHFGLDGDYLCSKLNNTAPCTTWVYGFISKKNKTVQPMKVHFTLSDEELKPKPDYDCHGGGIIDIDGDGHLDLYINNGAGRGIIRGIIRASVLFWGSETKNDDVWSISGGANVARDSSLENHDGDGRGRSAYFADFNFDGLIDVLIVNIERLDSIIAPSQVFYNKGNRTFVPDNVFSEYIQAVIYANSGRKKHRNADSIIIQRSVCEQTSFCTHHVTNSWAIYMYDEKTNQMRKTYDTITKIPGIGAVQNIQMADLNNDGIMDLFLSTQVKIHLFYSTKTTSAIFAMVKKRKPSEDILPPDGNKMSMAILDDFNLDGNMDIAAIFFNEVQKRFMTVFYSRPMFKKISPFLKQVKKKDFPSVDITKLNKLGEDYVKSHDIASVDYNSDGFKDIVLTTKGHIYFLTNMPESSKHGQNNFLAVVLVGNGKVNKYGIGSSLKLVVRGKENRNQVYSFYKSVNSFSHGTTSKGGASDHRIFFGLGKLYQPVELSITWPNGKKYFVRKWRIIKNMNNAANPLKISYPKIA